MCDRAKLLYERQSCIEDSPANEKNDVNRCSG